MGLGSGSDNIKRAMEEAAAARDRATGDALPDTDLMGTPAVAARQRAEFQALARQGLMARFLTSTRGTEGEAGAGLKGPPGEDQPLITTMSGKEKALGALETIQQKAARLERERLQREKDAADAAEAERAANEQASIIDSGGGGE